MNKSDYSEERQHLIAQITFFHSLHIHSTLEHSKHRKKLEKLEGRAYDLLMGQHEKIQESTRIQLAVVGSFSSGKSMFINSLLGENVCPTAVAPTTSSSTEFLYADTPHVVRMEDDGEVEISISEYLDNVQHGKRMDATRSHAFRYYYPFQGLRDITIHDTPGFENPANDHDDEVTRLAASTADVVFFIMDGSKGAISKSVMATLRTLRNQVPGAAWYFVANKADTLTKTSSAKVLNSARRSHKEQFVDYIAYSAKSELEASDKRVHEFFELLENKIRISVEEGTRFSAKLAGIPERRRYALSCNDDVITLNMAPNIHWSNRDQVLHTITGIKDTKHEIMRRRLDAMRKSYDRSVVRVLKAVREDLASDISASGDGSDKHELEDYRQKLTELYKYGEKYLTKVCAKAYRKCFRAQEIPKQKKYYLFSAYAKIVVYKSKATGWLEESAHWKEYWRRCEKFFNVLESDLGYSAKENLVWNHSAKVARQMRDCVDVVVEVSDLKGYDDIDEAKEAIELEFNIFATETGETCCDLANELLHEASSFLDKVEGYRAHGTEEAERELERIDEFLEEWKSERNSR